MDGREDRGVHRAVLDEVIHERGVNLPGEFLILIFSFEFEGVFVQPIA